MRIGTRLLGTLAIGAIVLAGTSARAADSDYDWLYKGGSESYIATKAGAAKVKEVMANYGVSASFTEADIRVAAGQAALRSLCLDHNLCSLNFTADDFIKGDGSRQVAAVLRIHPDLAPHFTIQELATARARGRMVDLETFLYPELKGPFDWTDYVHVAGNHEARDLVRKYNLPVNFTYADLVREAGPEEAASIRSKYGFAAQADHEGIVYMIGIGQASDFARMYHLPSVFSSQDLLEALTRDEVDQSVQFDHMAAQQTSDDLATKFGRFDLETLKRDFGIGAGQPFNAQTVVASAGEKAVSRLRDQYDLRFGFTASDVSEAASASAAADERAHYKLAHGFTAAEDAAAREEHQTNGYGIYEFESHY